jgi:hypothetical protein
MNNKNIIYLPCDQIINKFINEIVYNVINDSNIKNVIVIGKDYLYLEEELLEIINLMKNNVNLFIEKGEYRWNGLTKLLLDIDFKWTIIYGYKIISKKENENYYNIIISRPKITILYLTDKQNDLLENCKKSIYRYCKKYNYNFVHQYSKLYSKFFNRLDYASRYILDDEYICILYNYSYIVNNDLLITDIVRILCLDSYTLSLECINKKLLKNNIIFRNTRRLVDIIKELKYFEEDDNKMIKYIKRCIPNEINISSIHSYINKSGGYNIRAGFVDLVHTLNEYEMSEDNYDIMKTIQTHMGTNSIGYLCKNISFFNLVGRTYTIGNNRTGCNGTITFMSNNLLFSKKYESYRKMNSYSYEISYDDNKYLIIFFNNYEQYIGCLLNDIGDAIIGYLLR